MLVALLSMAMSFAIAGDAITLTPEARYHGDQGLRFQLPATGTSFVQDDTPAGEKTYRARFYVNPSQLQVGAGAGFHLFQGIGEQGQLWFFLRILEKEKALYLDLGVAQDNGTFLHLPVLEQVPLLEGYQALELAFIAGKGTGSLRLWRDGNQVAEMTDVPNGSASIEKINLGLAGARVDPLEGILDLDEFTSRRETYIGPLDCVATSQLYAQIPLWETTATLQSLVTLASGACPEN